MRPFSYLRAESLGKTIELIGQHGDGETRLLAGGTDLLTLMKAEIATPVRLVDIKRLDELPHGVTQTGEGLVIGALTSLSEIELSELIQQSYPALAQAAALAATPQLRNMATVGGNLLQRPRCWYFRHEHLRCWLKGGDDCPAYEGQNQLHALFGGGPCYAVHPSDLAPALLALDAQVWLRGSSGERTMPLEALFALPETGRRTETTIAPDELLTAVVLPPLAEGTHSLYLKAMDRKVWAFALVSVALRLCIVQGKIEEARLVLGGVAPIPRRVVAAEELLMEQPPDETLFARAAAIALADAQPLARNGYKVLLAQSLIRRALTTLVGVS
jgi:xanthine dehydrogenase YagS FAD-binding subunit